MNSNEVRDSQRCEYANRDGFGSFGEVIHAGQYIFVYSATTFSKGPTMPISQAVDGYKWVIARRGLGSCFRMSPYIGIPDIFL